MRFSFSQRFKSVLNIVERKEKVAGDIEYSILMHQRPGPIKAGNLLCFVPVYGVG